MYVAHTHPDEYGGTFSVDDMYFLTDSGIRGLYAVCNEGTYSLSPGPKGKPRSLMRAYDAAYLDALDKHGSDLVAIRKTLHGWLSENASSYGFSYVFKEVQ